MFSVFFPVLDRSLDHKHTPAGPWEGRAAPARTPLRAFPLPCPAARAVGNLFGESWSKAFPEHSQEAAGSHEGRTATPREMLLFHPFCCRRRERALLVPSKRRAGTREGSRYRHWSRYVKGAAAGWVMGIGALAPTGGAGPGCPILHPTACRLGEQWGMPRTPGQEREHGAELQSNDVPVWLQGPGAGTVT